MLRIVLVTAALAAGLAFAKDARVLERAELVGTCAPVAAPAGDTGAVYASCRPGRLEGRPDLTRRSCVSQGTAGRVEVWRCPAPVDSGAAVALESPSG